MHKKEEKSKDCTNAHRKNRAFYKKMPDIHIPFQGCEIYNKGGFHNRRNPNDKEVNGI